MRLARIAAAASLMAVVAPPATAQRPGVDIRAYHFRIDLPDSGSAIRGWATVLFATRAGYDDTLRLDLVDMTVDRVFDVETLFPRRFTYDGRVLRVGVPASAPGEELGVVVEYRGSPRDGLVFRTTTRGRRAAFADNYPDRARYWLPVVDHPSDKAGVLWSVRAPNGWRVVTNAPRACAARRTLECLESQPLPTYVMVLGAARMTVSRHRPLIGRRDTVPVEVWAYPEDSAWADAVPFRRATEIAETLARIVGPFPYARLAHVQSSTRYGGMENASAIFYSERAWTERRMGEGVVRHETAHQWFGDAVTPRDFTHVWLSEGFASYFDAVAGAALDGDSVLRRIMRGNRERWLGSDAVERPVIDSSESDPLRMLNASSYQKGAWVLHMLRGAVGDSAFFRGIRDYYRTWRDSSVVTAQFQATMERASGRSLGWFFDQWLRRPGHPVLDVTWSADRRLRRVEVRLRQVQPAGWGLYRVDRVPVRLVLPGGGVAERWIALRAEPGEQVHSYVMGGELPEQVLVDPDTTLLLTAEVRRAAP